MSEPMLRGYLLQRASSFIDHHFDAERAAKIKGNFPESLKVALLSLKPAEWYPREHCIVLHQVMANGVAADQVFDVLTACGEYMATEATNTYLQFVMRLLTPVLFCRKVPTFWKRDHSEGEFAVESASDKHIQMRLSNVGGFDHVGAVGAGFLRFGMKAVGAKARIDQTGWSMATPGPAEVRYSITWD